LSLLVLRGTWETQGGSGRKKDERKKMKGNEVKKKE
jgi:hypothetical protein